MAEMTPVTGTCPLRNPSSAERSSCGSISRPARTTGSPLTSAGRSMAANRSPGLLTTNSATSAATLRTPSTVTIESMPPPNGTRARPRLPPAARARARGAWAAGASAAGGWRFDAEVGEVEVVLVGVLAEALQVEVAQERALDVGQGGAAQVDDGRRGGLVVGDAGQQEDQPGGGPGGRGVPARPRGKRDPFGEVAPVQRVPAGQQPPLRVGGESLVPEHPATRWRDPVDNPWRTHHRRVYRPPAQQARQRRPLWHDAGKRVDHRGKRHPAICLREAGTRQPPTSIDGGRRRGGRGGRSRPPGDLRSDSDQWRRWSSANRAG